MSEEWLSRETALIGEDNVRKIARSRIIVFGAGGVGSYAIEALTRAGVGHISVVDGDTVAISNINRQIIADTSTVGKSKAEIQCRRITLINPSCVAVPICVFADESNTYDIIRDSSPDFIVDAIDCVSTKILIAQYAAEHDIPIISSMGTGNKLDPSKLQICDISKTSVCPLARTVRRKLRAVGIDHLPVLFSTELPAKDGQRTPSSVSFVPSAAGIIIASYVIRKIIGDI